MTTPFMKADVDQRAKEIGLTAITPDERIKIWEVMVSERAANELAAAENRLAAAAEVNGGSPPTPLA